MTFSLHSPEFSPNAEIPIEYTCDGKGICPPLFWTNPPSNTESFALIIDDPDAPDPKHPKRTWVHWIVYNIPKMVRKLPRGVSESSLPEGCSMGINDSLHTSYDPPAPPIGRHRYFFKIFALSKKLEGLNKPTKRELEAFMGPYIIGYAELIGTYQHQKE